jgi:signal transduction histidine kinase
MLARCLNGRYLFSLSVVARSNAGIGALAGGSRVLDPKFLDSAMQVGDQAIGEGRDAVQNLRSSSFDDRDLVTSLSALGTELGAGMDLPSRPEYRVVVEGRPRELTAVVRDEAYRIVREGLCNAYQHAKARHIETEVTFGDADLTIRVRDDGIGVDPQILARGQRPGHWGLPGMRERSESFGGHLHVWSQGNAGTEVELRIPAHVAYTQHPASISSRVRALLAAVVHDKLRRQIPRR